jgi:spore coat protein U-like protein
MIAPPHRSRAGRWPTLALASALSIISQPAQALLASCTVSASSVAFGTYNPTSATALDSTGTVTVTCIALVGLLVNWTITLNQGGSGNYLPRQMSSGAHTLNYNLYLDPARSTVWGNGNSGTSYVSDGLTLLIGSNNKSYYVYGAIPALQNAAAGNYLDTITVTMDY